MERGRITAYYERRIGELGMWAESQLRTEIRKVWNSAAGMFLKERSQSGSIACKTHMYEVATLGANSEDI